MDNVEGIAEMVPPKTATGICHFLGATGFYRMFIKGYAKIAQPLNDLIADENSKLKNQQVRMSPEAMEAFHLLKMKCMTAPVLVFTNFKQPFRLETDASKDGLGAVLSQKQSDGKYYPIVSLKLEFMALKWAIMDQFREYLQNQLFHVKMYKKLLPMSCRCLISMPWVIGGWQLWLTSTCF